MTSADVRARKMVLVETLVAGGRGRQHFTLPLQDPTKLFSLASFIVSYRVNRTASSRWGWLSTTGRIKNK